MEWMNSELREKERWLLECLVRTAHWMPSLSAVNVSSSAKMSREAMMFLRSCSRPYGYSETLT
jgi:hypothetical protein